MKAVLQRVARARVRVAEETVGEIASGLLVLLGVEQGDTSSDADYLAAKTAQLRIFEDEAGKMNLSLQDVAGAALVVSQFTLLADCRKGRRPGFFDAAAPDTALALYEYFASRLESLGVPVARGRFQADMDVELVNRGPVTMLLDSRKNY